MTEDTDEQPREDQPRLQAWIPDGAALSDNAAILDRFLAWIEGSGIEPYAAQEEALLEIAGERHVVLSTPTGSGKSLVALGMHFQALCQGRRSFYTAPVKALVSEKFFALCDELGAENVGMMTGDASVNWAAPVICCTAEVLSNMALRQGERVDAPYVVMDEFHYYADRDRGMAWQVPLLELPKTQFLLMSATLGNTAPIEERLRERSDREVAHVSGDERPVPLEYSYSERPVHECVERLLTENKAPIYCVQFTQRDAADQAQALTSAKVATRDEMKAISNAIGDFRFDSPFGKDLLRILRHGVGLHHAGLLPKYRLLVEQLASQGLLKVICGTDTLGVGVNVPIRTVLLTKLCKYDGEKTRILSVRDFKQISGRAGRKGFDDRGWVVARAPEHVIENIKLANKAASSNSKKPPKKKQPPKRGFVAWGKDTFEGLVEKPPEMLESRFKVTHGTLVSCLQREVDGGTAGDGYRSLARLIGRAHESDARKHRHRRDAARLFRALRRAELVEIRRDPDSGRLGVHVSEGLQRNFSLHHTLSLWLVEAIGALDAASESYPLDAVSCVEAILENPRPILWQQQRQARDEAMAEMKADRVPYEERIEKLDEIGWPRPLADFIETSFALFSDHHPWAEGERIEPKGIAREILESGASFHDYVRSGGHARVEGLLLRYLSQVHNTLAHGVPVRAQTDDLLDLIGYLRALVERVDSSLIEEWESMVSGGTPTSGAPIDPHAEARAADPAADPRAFKARVRGELQLLVRALAKRDYEEAARCVREDGSDPWTPERFTAELTAFYAEHDDIAFDPRAKQAHLTLIKEREPRVWDIHQTLVARDAPREGSQESDGASDEEAEGRWHLSGEIDLREAAPPGPLFRLLTIGE